MDRLYHSKLVGERGLDGFASGNDFLYIVVTEAPDQEVLA